MEANPQRCDIVKELEKQLIVLSISKLTVEMGRVVCACIEKMSPLVASDLRSINDDEVLNLQTMSPPSLLQHLSILSGLQNLPDWISSLHNLRRLNLSFLRLTDDPLKHLDKLPNLEHLFLYKAYIREQLRFEENGFQKLKTLKLRALPRLSAMIIGQGAMPLLEELDIGLSPLLKKLPLDIERLQNLSSLTFYRMDREFVLDLQLNGGSEYWKAKNVRHVNFCYLVDGRHYDKAWKLGDPVLLEHLQQ